MTNWQPGDPLSVRSWRNRPIIQIIPDESDDWHTPSTWVAAESEPGPWSWLQPAVKR